MNAWVQINTGVQRSKVNTGLEIVYRNICPGFYSDKCGMSQHKQAIHYIRHV